ncbi:MAG: hypothetical protein H6631_07085 [Anaerolineaceae bacterium]|nr:hypothetical protein [Anaerolineaceae bacterium]
MQTYHFTEVVGDDGTVTLSGLPPLTEVAIVVINPELSTWPQRMEQLMQAVQTDHPFTRMSRDEIMQQLRETRESVYGDLSED